MKLYVKRLKKDRVEINKKIEDGQESDILHKIKRDLNELNQHYTINKTQLTTSFRFSIMAIVAGLAIIIIGITLNYTGTKAIEITYLTGVSGVLLKIIGGRYFFIYKKNLEQVNRSFDRLIELQYSVLAIELAKDIKEDSRKTDMLEKIIVSLLERRLSL